MGLARQGEQRRDGGCEGVAEGRCKLTLVERTAGASLDGSDLGLESCSA